MYLPPAKKRKTQESPQTLVGFTLPPPPTPLRGQGFVDGIKELARGGSGVVYTQLDIPYQQVSPGLSGTSVNVPKRITAHGTFSVTTQQSNEGKKVWTQGMLQPMGDTSYFDDNKMGRAVPSTMTLKTATIESRAMKYLALDSYTPKNDGIKSDKKGPTEALGQKTKSEPLGKILDESHHWGGLTMGSYLEEITAQRGLGFQNVGSGMRAMTMASKWRMKTGGATSEAGFGDKMLASFPQLGKQAMKPSLGASVLWDRLNKGGTDRQQTLEHHLGFGGSIHKAHVEARTEAKKRFSAKLNAITSSGDARGHGTWWEKQAPHLADLNKPENAAKRSALRADYLEEKMSRHGITNYVGPTREAKDVVKKKAVEAGLDKSKDPHGYNAFKRHGVVSMLTTAGFTDQAAKVQAKWARKDNFDSKLHEHGQGVDVKGTWWKTKIESGAFKSLDDHGRKALRQEYVAYRKAKGK